MRQSLVVEVLSRFGVFGAGYAVAVLFASMILLSALHRLLHRCAPIHRMMPPAAVWLNLIPIFNLFWSFRTVARVTRTLRAEYADRRLPHRGDFAAKSGFAAIVLSIGSFTFLAMSPDAGLEVTVLGLFVMFVSLLNFIIYLTRVNDFTHQLSPWSEFGYDDPEEDGRPPLDIPLPANTERFVRRDDRSG